MGGAGSGGHNRKPRELKILEGTFRKDRNPGNEPKPEGIKKLPTPPSYLGKYGKRVWKTLVKELVKTKLLTTIDLPALELCCAAYEQYREARDGVYCTIIDPETGEKRKQTLAEYMRGRNSQTMPEHTAMTKAFALFKGYLIEFGMTPASRNRIDLPSSEKDIDPMEELLNAQ